MTDSGELIGSRTRALETSESAQSGNGAPGHTTADGTYYWDYTNSDLYINDSGVGTFGNSWQHIGGGGVAVPHQLLDNPWHTDTATNAPLRGAITVADATPQWARVVHPIAASRFLRANAADPGWAAILAGDLPNLGGVPALTYTTVNAGGAAATYVRTDASLAIFDVNVPTTIQCDDAAAVGVAAFAARRDHKHAIVNAIAVNIGNANAEGVSTSFSRADHVHDHVAALGVDLHHTEVHVVNSGGPHAEAGLTIGHVLRASGAAAFSFAAIQAGDLPNLGGMPALTYGVANAAGAAATYVRTDATIDIFDAIVPGTIQCDDAAAVGVAVAAARRDHQHAIVNAIAVDVGVANAEGVSTSFSRADHVHDHVAALGVDLHHTEVHVVNSGGPHAEAGLTIGHVLRASGAAAFSFAAIQAGDLPGLGGVPALTFTTVNAAGAAATYVQTDAQLAIFDVNVPTTIQADDAAAVGVAAFAARRDHVHGFPTVAPVNIGNANAEGTAYDFVRSDHVHNHPAGLGTDLHHTEVHVVNSGGPHAEAGLTIGHVLRASGAAAFSFAAIQGTDLPWTGAANRVAYWSGVNTLTSDAGLTVDAANDMYLVADGGGIGIGAAAERIEFYTAGYVAVMGANFGVGVASPVDLLHVRGTSKLAFFDRETALTDVPHSMNVMRVTTSGNMTDGFGARLRFEIEDNAAVRNIIGLIGAVRDGADNEGALVLWCGTDGSEEFARITSAGRLGVGTASPGTIAHARITDTATITTTDVLTLEHITSNTVDVNFGAGILYKLETAGASVDAMKTAVVWETAGGTENAEFQLWLNYNGALRDCGVVIAPGAAPVAGLQRGVGAVDWQGMRAGGTQIASGDYAVVSGGARNASPGDYATSPGGYANTATGNYSWAGGWWAGATHQGSYVWSNSAATTNSWGNDTWTSRCHGGARFYTWAGVATGIEIVGGTGDLVPLAAKTHDLGSSALEWDNIYYVTANTGTSRLINSSKKCPICDTQMKRGTGTVCIMGEDADYAMAFCIQCGNVAVEEWNHHKPDYKSRREPPPEIVVENIRVKGAGRHREVAVDFRYGNVRNSTRLGDDELEIFANGDDKARERLLYDLGLREWESREENRLMQTDAAELEGQLRASASRLIGVNIAR